MLIRIRIQNCCFAFLLLSCANKNNSTIEDDQNRIRDSLVAAERFDIDRKSDSVLALMEPIVARGQMLSGYHRLVYTRNRADHITQLIEETDSLYRAYLKDENTGDSRENMLVSYVHFLSSNRLVGLAERHSDTLVAIYGIEGRYRDLRHMYYFLGASARSDCESMNAHLDSLRGEVEKQGSRSIVNTDLLLDYDQILTRKCR